MTMSAGIGQSIRIKGEITAKEPFLIAGHVEGTVEVDGHTLTVAEGASLDATVTADMVVIQGKVNGEMSAASKIVVGATASIEGDYSAPVISIAEGATIQAKVATTKKAAKLSKVS